MSPAARANLSRQPPKLCLGFMPQKLRRSFAEVLAEIAGGPACPPLRVASRSAPCAPRARCARPPEGEREPRLQEEDSHGVDVAGRREDSCQLHAACNGVHISNSSGGLGGPQNFVQAWAREMRHQQTKSMVLPSVLAFLKCWGGGGGRGDAFSVSLIERCKGESQARPK